MISYQDLCAKIIANTCTNREIEYSFSYLPVYHYTENTDPATISILKALEKNQNLSEIFLGLKGGTRGKYLTKEEVEALANMIKFNKGIKKIRLELTIETDGLKILRDAFYCNKTIDKIDLYFNHTKFKLSDDERRELDYEICSIPSCHLFNAFVDKIATNKCSEKEHNDFIPHRLDSSFLPHEKVYKRMVAYCDALKQNTTLEKINLFYNKLGDDGAKLLAEVLKVNTHIKELDIGFCDIRGIGCIELCNALKINSTLKCLHYWPDTDEDAKIFCDAMKENGSIIELKYWSEYDQSTPRQLAILNRNKQIFNQNLAQRCTFVSGVYDKKQLLPNEPTPTLLQFRQNSLFSKDALKLILDFADNTVKSNKQVENKDKSESENQALTQNNANNKDTQRIEDKTKAEQQNKSLEDSLKKQMISLTNAQRDLENAERELDELLKKDNGSPSDKLQKSNKKELQSNETQDEILNNEALSEKSKQSCVIS